jgi:DNA-binding CsgD family transcriptional regulator
VGHLTAKELRKLMEFIRELYQLRSRDEFTKHLLGALPSVTEGEFTSYNEINPVQEESVFHTDVPFFLRHPKHYGEVLARHAKAHPILNRMEQSQNGEAVTFSDVLPISKFRDSALYSDFYKPLRIPYIIGIALDIDKRHSITIARHSDGGEFNERTRSTLNAIRPHVVQGFRNAMAVTQMRDQLGALNHAMEDAHQALLSVTPEGRIKWATPSAYALLKKYNPEGRHRSDRLPSTLSAWLLQQPQHLYCPNEVATPMVPLLVPRENGFLRIRLVRNGSQWILILEEQRHAFDGIGPGLVELSKRENEVLGWVAQGKTNPEIGTILAISPRTVQKHLEHIYGRLGVENRHAAIRVVLDASRRETSDKNYTRLSRNI